MDDTNMEDVYNASYGGSLNCESLAVNASNFSVAANCTLDERRVHRDLGLHVQIPIYAIIFLLALVGNALVIVTLIQNKKMRTVTNVFLMNLSLSDLLLAIFCMPFTLIPMLMRNFVFGETMCILIRYLQAVAVAVSCFTLVAISLERYFAICRPLKSRGWQTLSHAYKIIGICWIVAFLLMVPIAVYHRLIVSRRGVSMCMEVWNNHAWEKAYTVIINLSLLVIPILVMGAAYGRICYELWSGIKNDEQADKENQKNGTLGEAQYESSTGILVGGRRGTKEGKGEGGAAATTQSGRPFRKFEFHRVMRQSNSEKSRASRKRVIKMLFAVVFEFFLCWTPTYVIITWMIFDPKGANRSLSPMTKSLVHLLSYVSTFCNPITYCFMNRNFRLAFIAAFRCMRRRYVYARRSEMSFSGNTASTRTGMSQVSTYDKIHESDEVSEKSL